ncbi:MAG TPA: hypothetical protein VJS63_04840 [Bradyrhizobium sp.]|nr:hypothetical protein [Bradyrhizobium sp.]
MDSMLKPREADDPHDAPITTPDVVPAAWADKVLADIKRDAVSVSAEPKPAASAASAPVLAPTPEPTFRVTASDKIPAPGDKRSGGGWISRTAIAFIFALCSAIAAAAWQHYGDTAKQMVAKLPSPFVLAQSLTEKPAAAEQPATPAVLASTADQAAPQPATPAQPAEAAPAAAALAPESEQLLQSMARDLASMGQQIEQLKASVAELKAAQQPISPTAARAPEPRAPETRAPEPRAKLSALPPRPAPPVRRPTRPLYPAAQATAAPPMTLTAPPPPPPPELQPQAAVQQDEPVVRPPMPLR